MIRKDGQRLGWHQCVGVCFLLACLCGCTTTRWVSDTYMRPAEINMVGRKTVVLEAVKGQGQSQSGADIVTSRLRQALLGKGFTVLDRDSMDAKAREEFFGEGQSAEVVSATVLIRGNLLQNNFSTQTETSTRKNKDGYQYNVYRTVGSATAEVAFDVVDLGSTKVIISSSIPSGKSQASDWYTGGAPRVDSAPVFSACYEEVVAQFMRKIAPYQVYVNYNVYPVKQAPRSNAGVSLLQANRPNDAYEEFKAARETARNLPEIKPKVLGLLTHNMAVAKERAGEFDAAMNLYVEASRYAGTPNQSADIARCRQRLADQARLKQQGVN
jgi:hypothetical protein